MLSVKLIMNLVLSDLLSEYLWGLELGKVMSDKVKPTVQKQSKIEKRHTN
jgi:hypothetical protein